jgi:hypothetical protein
LDTTATNSIAVCRVPWQRFGRIQSYLAVSDDETTTRVIPGFHARRAISFNCKIPSPRSGESVPRDRKTTSGASLVVSEVYIEFACLLEDRAVK